MKDFRIIQSLLGENLLEEELQYMDCYVRGKLGLFIPNSAKFNYAQKENHVHPSYMIAIHFVKNKNSNSYPAKVLAPNMPHSDETNPNYYFIMINKAYFEEQYELYTGEEPDFVSKEFCVHTGILKILNTFSYEYVKGVPNSYITMGAQVTIITHWIIRSMLEESLDKWAISDDYTVARVQQYMERHFDEPIKIPELAELVQMPIARLHRIFKEATGQSPLNYLIEIRVEKAKILLRKREIPMMDIAVRCGFSDGPYFGMQFKRVTHVTPSEYREEYFKRMDEDI